MTESRVCRACGKAKPTSQFPAGRRVCKGCYAARYTAKHSAAAWFSAGFTCRSCRVFTPGAGYARSRQGLCNACYREYVLARKAAAPAVLMCRSCGESKPKEDFEKYSLTRCKACAASAVKALYHRKKEKRQ